MIIDFHKRPSYEASGTTVSELNRTSLLCRKRAAKWSTSVMCDKDAFLQQSGFHNARQRGPENSICGRL